MDLNADLSKKVFTQIIGEEDKQKVNQIFDYAKGITLVRPFL